MNVMCTNCGQTILVENTLAQSFCPFCGNELVIADARTAPIEIKQVNPIAEMMKEIETLFDQQSYEDCIIKCEESISSDPGLANPLLYKAMCLMKLSSLGENYSEEAVQVATRARKCSNNPQNVCDWFLWCFDTEMTRICRELLEAIEGTNRFTRMKKWLSVTHDIMNVFTLAADEFSQAEYSIYYKSYENCAKCVRFLGDYSHDAAKKFNMNRPYHYNYKVNIKRLAKRR